MNILQLQYYVYLSTNQVQYITLPYISWLQLLHRRKGLRSRYYQISNGYKGLHSVQYYSLVNTTLIQKAPLQDQTKTIYIRLLPCQLLCTILHQHLAMLKLQAPQYWGLGPDPQEPPGRRRHSGFREQPGGGDTPAQQDPWGAPQKVSRKERRSTPHRQSGEL